MTKKNWLKDPLLWKAIVVSIVILVLNLILTGFGFGIIELGTIASLNFTALVLNVIVGFLVVAAVEYFGKNGKIRAKEDLVASLISGLVLTFLGGYFITTGLTSGSGFLVGFIVLTVALFIGFWIGDSWL